MARVPTVERKAEARLDSLPDNAVYRHAYKKMWIAYVLHLVGFGVFGVHRFYLLYYRSACAQLALAIVYVFSGLAVPLVSDAAGIVLVVWLIVDLFLIPGLTRARNATIAADIDTQVEAMR